MKARAWCFRAALCLVGVHVVLWRWLAWQGDGAGTPTKYSPCQLALRLRSAITLKRARRSAAAIA